MSLPDAGSPLGPEDLPAKEFWCEAPDRRAPGRDCPRSYLASAPHKHGLCDRCLQQAWLRHCGAEAATMAFDGLGLRGSPEAKQAHRLCLDAAKLDPEDFAPGVVVVPEGWRP